MEEDALAGSLFDDLARPDTTIDLIDWIPEVH